MSISNFQDKFIKGGCGPAVLIFCAAVMFGGMFYSCSQANLQQHPNSLANQNPGITVAGTSLPAFYVQEKVESQMRQILPMLAAQPTMNTPEKEAEFYGQAIDSVSNEAVYVALAQKNGADLSDEGLKKIAAAQVEEQIASAREQAVASKKLKENATDKEWEDFFQKEYKRSLADVRKTSAEGLQKQLTEPGMRQGVVIALAQAALNQALEAKFKMTDDEVRRANESVTYKRIVFKSEVPGKPAAERAEAALKAIQGGLKFETAIDRYSNELPVMNKKLSESTQSASGAQTMSDPQFAPLATLKAGEVSGIVDVPEGKAIYKVVSRSPAPADFDKKKETYRKSAVSARVQAEIAKQTKELKDAPNGVKIDMPSYALAFQFLRLNQGGIVDPAKANALYEEAGKVFQKGTDTNIRLAALVRYGALMLTQADPTVTPEAFRKKQIEAMRAILESGGNFDLRMRLVDLLLLEKDNEAASQELLNARRDITTFDDAALDQVRRVSAKRLQMKNEKTLTAEAEKEILEEQTRWQKDKEETDRIAAEQKKEQEAEAKKAAEDAKKAEAEAKKNAPKTATPPTTTATTGTATTAGTTAAGTTTTGTAPTSGQ